MHVDDEHEALPPTVFTSPDFKAQFVFIAQNIRDCVSSQLGLELPAPLNHFNCEAPFLWAKRKGKQSLSTLPLLRTDFGFGTAERGRFL